MKEQEKHCSQGCSEYSVIESLENQLDWRIREVAELNKAIKEIECGNVQESTLRTVMTLGVRR